ncbi:MAG: DUF3568 domain-containing protein [Nitrospirales bacterium]|nr:DUF3568 domain-containing protein [Nitrospirales bacterium]
MTCKCLWGSTGKVFGLWVVSFVLLTAGCVALMVGAGAGAAGAVYVMGKLQERVEASVPQVRKATWVKVNFVTEIAFGADYSSRPDG